MKNNLILDYIRAATQLYGAIPEDKIVEIYNMQNEDMITVNDLDRYQHVENEFFKYFDGHFVHECLLLHNDPEPFYELLMQKEGKPYYIPSKDKLLKHADPNYVERTKEYERLKNYIISNFIKDPVAADALCEDIQLICSLEFSIRDIFYEFERRDIAFESEKQINDLLKLIMNLANNTRIWENNGHTPDELFNSQDKPKLRPLPKGRPASPDKVKSMSGSVSGSKIGRNDPCPCGSGKKYKKCCLGREK